MDAIDQQILTLLQKDGRMTMKQLGIHIGMTAQAAAERVRKLEEKGIITGYRAAVNPEKLNKHVTAYVLMDTHQCKGFVEFCQAHPDVVECHRLAGPYSYLTKIVTDSVKGVEAFIDAVMPYGKSTTMVVLSSSIAGKPVPVAPNSEDTGI